MTLADEDTNSILTDNANRAFHCNVAMRVTQPGGQLWNQAMQVTSPDDQILNQFATNQKCIPKRNTNLISRNIANLKLRNMRASHSRFSSQTEQTLSTVILANIKLISVRKLIQVIDSIPWVRCASGNVFLMPPLIIDLWLGDQSQF